MPKTDAERQRERRARIKADEGKFYLYKAADSLRKQKRRLQLSPVELDVLRRRTKANTQKWRQNKRDAELSDKTGSPYKSPGAFTKAKNRVKQSLPSDPRKRSAVLQDLASGIPSDNPMLGGRQRPENPAKAEVLRFYNSEAVSRVAPGKADVIVVKHGDGSKATMQKRHMTMTISEAFQVFKADQPSFEIGKSLFASFRPTHVFLSSQMPHNVCGCKYHNNVIRLLESLHKKFPGIPLYSKEGFVSLCVCDILSDDCMSNTCEKCSNGQLFDSNVAAQADAEAEMRWYQWTEDYDGYLVKLPVDGTVGEGLEHLRAQLLKFFWHCFIKDKQSKSYESDKAVAELPDSTSCVLQMDFAENYTASFQDEIQSAHWRQKQVTVYTLMMWSRELIKSGIIVSDVRDHEKTTVSAYTSMALSVIREEMPFVKTVDIWTDGPSSQFKNRFIFALLWRLEVQFNPKITWNYFATSHGKGPNDALGGNAKRMVHRQVLSRKVVVSGAESFATAVKSVSAQIRVVLATQEDIDNRCRDLGAAELWEQVPAIPGTVNFHSVRPLSETEISGKFYKSSTNSAVRRIARVQNHKVDMGMAAVYRSGEVTATSGSDGTESNSDSDEIPLAELGRHGQDPCGQCGWTYGNEMDPRKSDDWIQCSGCKTWYHDTCAEEHGLVDINVFTCGGCL